MQNLDTNNGHCSLNYEEYNKVNELFNGFSRSKPTGRRRFGIVRRKELYKDSNHIISLDESNFDRTVYNQPHGTQVIFYNSFCGFCKRQEKQYEQHARNLRRWHNVVRVAAVNCALIINIELCRAFDMTFYNPLLIFFPPMHNKQDGHMGIVMEHPPMYNIKREAIMYNSILSVLMKIENKPDNWPKLNVMPAKSLDEIFSNSSGTMEYLFILSDSNMSSTVAQEVALDFSSMPDIEIRQNASTSQPTRMMIVNAEKKTIENSELEENDRDGLNKFIRKYLEDRGHPVPDEQDEHDDAPILDPNEPVIDDSIIWDDIEIDVESDEEDINRNATPNRKLHWTNATVPFEIDDTFSEFIRAGDF